MTPSHLWVRAQLLDYGDYGRPRQNDGHDIRLGESPLRASRTAAVDESVRTRASRTSCACDTTLTPLLSVRAQPLDNGEYGDPAKMTGTIFAFPSRPSVLRVPWPAMAAHCAASAGHLSVAQGRHPAPLPGALRAVCSRAWCRRAPVPSPTACTGRRAHGDGPGVARDVRWRGGVGGVCRRACVVWGGVGRPRAARDVR